MAENRKRELFLTFEVSEYKGIYKSSTLISHWYSTPRNGNFRIDA